jgi:hypothetical protein
MISWDLSILPLQTINFLDWQDAFFQGIAHLSHHGTILAQRVDNVDILGDIQKSFQHFIKSGQVWALAIGFVAGYMFRNFTAY